MKKEFLRSSWKHALLLCSAAIVLTLLVLSLPNRTVQATYGPVPYYVDSWSPAGGAQAECNAASAYTGVSYNGALKIDGTSNGVNNGTYGSGAITIYGNYGWGFSWTSTPSIGAVIVKAATHAYIFPYSPAATAGYYLYAPEYKTVSHATFCWNVSCPVGQVLSGGSCVTACVYDSSIPASSPSCHAPCATNETWNGTACVITSCPTGQVLINGACLTACPFNSAIAATNPACPSACPFNSAIAATNPACPSACPFNSAIASTDPACPSACEYDASIPSTSPDCHEACAVNETWDGESCVPNSCPTGQVLVGSTCVTACPFNGDIAATDPACPSACEYDASIPSTSPDCHVPCADNETWNGTACVIVSCPVGQLLIEGECVDACEFNAAIPASSADCHEGCAVNETWNGESCVPNSCPTGEVLINDVCVTACATNPSLAADDPGCTLPPPVKVLSGLSVVLDPFCSVDGQMQWTVENPNSVTVYVTDWTVDGAHMGPLFATPGSTRLTATVLGTHTVTLYYDDGKTASLTDSLSACPLTIPVTGTGGLLIPVTGADLSAKIYLGLLCAGLSLTGIALLRKQLLKRLTH